jgi:hypothetical protein
MPIVNPPRSAGFFGARFSISVDQHQTLSGVRSLPFHFFIAAAYGQKGGGEEEEAKIFRHPYIRKIPLRGVENDKRECSIKFDVKDRFSQNTPRQFDVERIICGKFERISRF